MADPELAARHQVHLCARFAAMQARVSKGSLQRIDYIGQQHLPGEEVWLVSQHRTSGEYK